MSDQILIVIMVTLGLGLSTVTPYSVSPGLVKGMAWFKEVWGVNKLCFR